MQWPPVPAVPMEAPVPSPSEYQVAKEPARFEASMTHHQHGTSTTASSTGDDVLLRTLAPMDRSQLYDLAELLLSELIPGWDEDGSEDSEEEDDDDVDFEDMEADAGAVDVVVDASYRACIAEAERYLVQYEGFDAQGSVVAGMREHLHLARVSASATAPPRVIAHRPPGYP